MWRSVLTNFLRISKLVARIGFLVPSVSGPTNIILIVDKFEEITNTDGTVVVAPLTHVVEFVSELVPL